MLEDLFADIVRDYRFLIEKTHIQVISGQLEGVYSWIAINYVLGRFQNNNTDSSKFKIQRKISILFCIKIDLQLLGFLIWVVHLHK